MGQIGFYTDEEIEQVSQIDIKSVDQDSMCLKCGMYRRSKSPKLFVTGEGRRRALIVAEASGEFEDIKGTQLVGKVGKFFRRKLQLNNVLLDRDFFKINACGCRPHSGGSNRTPTDDEIRFCRPNVERAIEETKPQFIWVMGGVAAKSFWIDDFKKNKITRWRGLCIPDQKYKAYIMPLYHPSFPMRDLKDLNLQSCYDRDLLTAIRRLNLKPFEDVEVDKEILCVTDFIKVISILDDIQRNAKSLTFDYETNCKKPYVTGSKIASISVCFNSSKAYSFPYQYADHFTHEERQKIKLKWRKIMKNRAIRKEAHNIKFEHNWTKVHFDVEPQGWAWDTMIAAHVIDNREKYTSLNFQTYINLGIRPYDRFIKGFLRAKRGVINTVMNAPLDSLLLYGGKDSLYSKMIKKCQIQEIRRSKKLGARLDEAYKFFHDGALAMAHIERTGIAIDEDHYHEEGKRFDARIAEAEKTIINSKAAAKFKKIKGRPLQIKKDVSNDDLRILFYDVLKKSKDKQTASGLGSVDEETLKKWNHPLGNAILERRKLLKVRGTYFNQFLREAINGFLYPFFDLHLALTYRGNSYEPNFHNIPKRDAEAKRATRSGIMPRKGRQLGDVDFSGIEVSIGCCYHKDPQMIKYLVDPKSDMHRDAACDIWMLPPSEIEKMIRFFSKNQWVFPQFYGSYFGNCAPNLWSTCLNLKTNSGTPLKEHIRRQGITRYHTFEEHCKDVEKKFWNRLKVYKAWKDSIQRLYRKQGYIETFLGFRFTGLLSYNEATNYPIQGTAFHMLLWTLIKTIEKAVEEKWETDLLGHIHDQIVFDFVPEEVKHIFKTVNHIGTKMIRKKFKWINVPLSLDATLAPVGKSWYDTEEVPIV